MGKLRTISFFHLPLKEYKKNLNGGMQQMKKNSPPKLEKGEKADIFH